MIPRLVPEIACTNLDASLEFYRAAGFEVKYDRPTQRFAYLTCDGVDLMLEEAPGIRPLGSGVHFQIEVADITVLHDRLSQIITILRPLEIAWYARMTDYAGNKQFVCADPDGVELRFFEALPPVTERPITGPGIRVEE